MKYKKVWEASEIGSAFPLARAVRGKWILLPNLSFSVTLSLLNYNVPFLNTLSYDLKTHSLPFIFFALTHLFSQKFSMLQWKNTSFPKVIHCEEEQNRRSRNLPGWAVPMGCREILTPGIEPSWARSVQGAHIFSCIPLHYLQVELAWSQLSRTQKTECYHLTRLEGARGPLYLSWYNISDPDS